MDVEHFRTLLLDFVTSKNLLSDNQYGFRKGRSTVIPLLLSVHQWHTHLERRHRSLVSSLTSRRLLTSFPTRPSWTSWINCVFQERLSESQTPRYLKWCTLSIGRSANIWNLASWDKGKNAISFRYKKSRGPRIGPCGMPDLTGNHDEQDLLRTILWKRPDK